MRAPLIMRSFACCLNGVLCGLAHSVLSLPALDIGVGGSSPGVGMEASFVDLGRDHMTVTVVPAQWVQNEVSSLKRTLFLWMLTHLLLMVPAFNMYVQRLFCRGCSVILACLTSIHQVVVQ